MSTIQKGKTLRGVIINGILTWTIVGSTKNVEKRAAARKAKQAAVRADYKAKREFDRKAWEVMHGKASSY